jgi:hypothetical protein
VSRAYFILKEAAAAGIRVGTDGDGLLLVPPRGMPHESWFSFERAIIEHQTEIIEIIRRENAK